MSFVLHNHSQLPTDYWGLDSRQLRSSRSSAQPTLPVSMPEPWRPRRRPSRWLIPLLLLGGLVVFHELLDSSILDIGLFPRQDDGQVRGISVKLRKELRKLVVAVVEPTPWHTG